MKPIKVDVHTHSIMSGHGFGTLDEMCRAAGEKRLEIYGIADHGPAMPGSCNEIYFGCYNFVPRHMYGTRILLGCEMNILDNKGTLDLTQRYIDELDIRIAGIHANKCGDFKEHNSVTYNTEAYLAVIANKDIDIISHPDAVDSDIDELCIASEKYHTLLEVNANSMSLTRIRPHAIENIHKILTTAKKHDLQVILSSDAHFMPGIGDVSALDNVIKETQFPEELIINYRPDDFMNYIKENHPIAE